MNDKLWAENIEKTQSALKEHPMCPAQHVYVADLPDNVLTAVRSFSPGSEKPFNLIPGEPGIVLSLEANDEWQGYWVMLEKTGIVWVEWYKVRAA